MIIAARNSFLAGKSILPPGARWVGYLQSTGTQWIDTGCKSTTTLEFRVKLDNSTMPDKPVSCGYFGTIGYWGNFFGNYYYLNSDLYAKVMWVRPNWRYRGNQIGMIEAYCGLNSITINGVVGQMEKDSGNYYGGNIEIFRGKNGYTQIKMYSMQIYDKGVSADGVLVRDFAPIAIGNTGYMLDLLTGDYLQYRNKGTGNFIIGPDI